MATENCEKKIDRAIIDDRLTIGRKISYAKITNLLNKIKTYSEKKI